MSLAVNDPEARPLRISIVINTYNRAALLEKLLASFGHLDYEHFEVVVVNGPSTDGTADLLEQYAGRIKAVACPVAHMTTSRNLGIAAAAGDVLVFIDDDALPADRKWLANIARAFAEGPPGKAVGAVGGPAFHYDTPFFQFRQGMTSDYVEQVFWGDQPGAPEADGVRWVRRTVGCNSAFSREALREIGGFDEWINYYGDEADVSLRLTRRGYAILQPDDCAVRHYPAQSSHLGAPFLRNRRIITLDATYSSLKNGTDPLPVRLAKTLWLAPRRHFVREMPGYWKQGRISLADLLGFYTWDWPRGLLRGLEQGLLRHRRTARFTSAAPPFLPFPKPSPERKLRVGIITIRVPPDANISGVERYAYDLAKGLHRLGHEVHVFCRSEIGLRRDGLGFTVHGIPREAYIRADLLPGRPVVNRNVGYGLAVSQKIQQLYQEGTELDVLHASNWDLQALCLPYLRMYPFVLMLVSPLVEVIETQGWDTTDDLELAVALDRHQIEQADLLCAPSRGILPAYQKHMRIDFGRLPPVRTVALGTSPTLRPPRRPAPADRRRLLFVGRLEHRKGAHMLLEVLPELLALHADWQCDLVGAVDVPGHGGRRMMERFLARHADAPWIERVRFHGAVSDEVLNEFYERCDVFVAPSLFESFGLTLVEAMQFGKPVVAARTSGVPEVVSDGIDGLLVAPGDAPALAAALGRLMSDRALRERLGQAGRRAVMERLNHVAMAERMVAIYLEAIARTGEERRRDRHARFGLGDATLLRPEVSLEAPWSIRERRPGGSYVFTDQPGSALRFEVPGGGVLSLIALRHPRSGVLRIDMDGQPPRYLDLFSVAAEPDVTRDFLVPGSPEKHVRVVVRVHPERNPESRASEVWLRRITYSAARTAVAPTTA